MSTNHPQICTNPYDPYEKVRYGPVRVSPLHPRTCKSPTPAYTYVLYIAVCVRRLRRGTRTALTSLYVLLTRTSTSPTTLYVYQSYSSVRGFDLRYCTYTSFSNNAKIFSIQLFIHIKSEHFIKITGASDGVNPAGAANSLSGTASA